MRRFSANGTTRVEMRKLVISFVPRCEWTYGKLPPCSTDMIDVRATRKKCPIKMTKIRTGGQHAGYLCYSANP